MSTNRGFGVYGSLQSNEKGFCRMKEGFVGFMFLNWTENVKIYKEDGWRQCNPSECVFVHVMCMKENVGSLTSVQRNTWQQGTNVYSSMCVCAYGWNLLIVQRWHIHVHIRGFSHAHHSGDRLDTEGLCIQRNWLPANWVKVQRPRRRVKKRSSSVQSPVLPLFISTVPPDIQRKLAEKEQVRWYWLQPMV